MKTKKTRNKSQIELRNLVYNAGIAAWYLGEMRKIIDRMTKETNAAILGIYDDGKEQVSFAQDAAVASDLRIKTNNLSNIFKVSFSKSSRDLAQRFVDKSLRHSTLTINEALKKIKTGENENALSLSGSVMPPELEEVIKASIQENVSLIRSLPDQYYSRITGAVTRSIQSGGSLEQLRKELLNFEGMTKRRANIIALDQTRKVYNSITARKLNDMGVKKFKWLHSGGGQHPRSFHMMSAPSGLNGGIFDMNDPPIIDPKTGEKGFPAQLPNCKCRMVAVIDFDDL